MVAGLQKSFNYRHNAVKAVKLLHTPPPIAAKYFDVSRK